MFTNHNSPLAPLGQMINLGLIAIVLLFIFGYSLFQSRYLILGPNLTLDEDIKTVHNTRKITISGTAKNISHLWLNDRPIYTNLEGVFNEVLILENGYTIVTIKATDRYGREDSITKKFVYKPASFIP